MQVTIIPFRQNRSLQLMIAGYVLLWTWLAIEPVHRFNWFLENLLIFLAVAVLVGTYRLFAFSNLAYGLILLFLSLHTIGAHYTYATTPIDVWLNGMFHFERNQYDRIVHFSFGLLIAYPLWELLVRVPRFQPAWSYVMTVVTILSAGAFYELIEMWVAQIVAPEIGTMFLGTQGDEWDTQQDMALALYASIVTMAVTALVRSRPAAVSGRSLDG
jgi:putative membrane protein